MDTSNTGFVFYKSSTDTALYKHKAGTKYPVTCRLIQYTNLTWRDYNFNGKIVKPVGSVYDSIWVGLDIYSANGMQYRFKFRNDTMLLNGGR
jgi:hypothetical protein